jgi:hypothetical protein
VAIWIKAHGSNSQGNCVEVAALPGGNKGVRDSKRPNNPYLTFSRPAWQAFMDKIKRGEFNL